MLFFDQSVQEKIFTKQLYRNAVVSLCCSSQIIDSFILQRCLELVHMSDCQSKKVHNSSIVAQ